MLKAWKTKTRGKRGHPRFIVLIGGCPHFRQAEQYRFIILIVPLMLLLVEWPRFNWLKRSLLLVPISSLILAFPYKSPNLSGGLLSLLAYPRLDSAVIVCTLFSLAIQFQHSAQRAPQQSLDGTLESN